MLRLALGPAVAVAIAAFPSAAVAQRVVPPGNSAVNQYTETYPMAGGDAAAAGGGKRSPAKALGTRSAQKLDALGPEGRAAATLAAATSPARRGPEGRQREAGGVSGSPAIGSAPGGSSGLSAVIGQATGSSSSGQLGLLLPLVILAAIIGSVVYLWRRRRTNPQAPSASGAGSGRGSAGRWRG